MNIRPHNPRPAGRAAAPAVAAIVGTVLGSAHPAGATETTAQLAPLGQPDHIGYIVTDVRATAEQLARATGSTFVFSEKTVEVQDLTDPPTRRAKVTLHQAVSTRETGPTTELVQADPAIGPWTRGDRDQVFLSYEVAEVSDYEILLERSGLRLLVKSDAFAFWKGPRGVIIRLITADIVEVGPSTPAAPIDLGPPAAVALFPCDIHAVADQVSQALGIAQREPQTYTLPWMTADGNVHMLSATSILSQEAEPFIALEAPHGFPGEDDCTDDYAPSYLVYVAADVAMAEKQLADAGLRLIARVPGLIAAYRGEGVSVEVASPAFVPTA